MSETLIVKYSCHQCGLKKIEVAVRLREEAEDIVKWVEDIVGWAIKDDHRLRSPDCNAKSVQDLMIPITGVNRLGGPVIQ